MTWATVAAILLTAAVAFVASRATTWLNERRVVWVRSSCFATWLDVPGGAQLSSGLENNQRCPQAHVKITNVGDGDAYGVHLLGFGCTVEPRWKLENSGLVPEGLGASMLGHYKTYVASRDGLDMRVLTDTGAWNDAWLVLMWRQPPMIRTGPRGMRVKTFRLCDLAGPEPAYTRLDIEASGGAGEIPKSHDVPEGYGVLDRYSRPSLAGLPGVERWTRIPWSRTGRLELALRRFAASESPRVGHS